MYGLSSFFVGEQRVAAELGPIMRACPDEDMRIFLCTQIADEARHVAFFDRFYSEVGVLEADGLKERLAETSEHLNPEFGVLFDELLRRRVDRLAREPEDLEALVEAITIYHMVIEGMLALTGQHFIIDYNETHGHAARRSWRASPTSHATSTATWPSARASCARWPSATSATPRRSAARWPRSAPAADGVLRPKWIPAGEEDTQFFGASRDRNARVRDARPAATPEGHRPGRLSVPRTCRAGRRRWAGS